MVGDYTKKRGTTRDYKGTMLGQHKNARDNKGQHDLGELGGMGGMSAEGGSLVICLCIYLFIFGSLRCAGPPPLASYPQAPFSKGDVQPQSCKQVPPRLEGGVNASVCSATYDGTHPNVNPLPPVWGY